MTTNRIAPDAVTAEQARRLGIAHVLAMLSGLVANDPDGLVEVLTADLAPNRRWDELKRKVTGGPVRVDDVLFELGLTGCAAPLREWIDFLWTQGSARTLERLCDPLTAALSDRATPVGNPPAPITESDEA